jgi:hypothetical protein
MELEASKHDDAHFRQTMYSQLRTALFQISPKAKWGEKARKAAQVLQSFSLSIDPSSGAPTLSLDVAPAEGLVNRLDHRFQLAWTSTRTSSGPLN